MLGWLRRVPKEGVEKRIHFGCLQFEEIHASYASAQNAQRQEVGAALRVNATPDGQSDNECDLSGMTGRKKLNFFS